MFHSLGIRPTLSVSFTITEPQNGEEIKTSSPWNQPAGHQNPALPLTSGELFLCFSFFVSNRDNNSIYLVGSC